MTASSHEDDALTQAPRALAEGDLVAIPVAKPQRSPRLDLDLYSCAVGDSGCTDPTCWTCHSPLRPENLRTLADNLATAAMLFFAWQLRAVCPEWQPGCGDRPRLPSLMEAAISSPRVGTFLRKRSA